MDGPKWRAGVRFPQGQKGQDTQTFGRRRGGFTTNTYAAYDALGQPLRFLLTGG